MDTWVRMPKAEGVQEYLTFLLETLEKVQPYGQHDLDVRTDGARGGEYAAWDIETGKYSDPLERALLGLMTYAAEITDYTLPPLDVNHLEDEPAEMPAAEAPVKSRTLTRHGWVDSTDWAALIAEGKSEDIALSAHASATAKADRGGAFPYYEAKHAAHAAVPLCRAMQARYGWTQERYVEASAYWMKEYKREYVSREALDAFLTQAGQKQAIPAQQRAAARILGQMNVLREQLEATDGNDEDAQQKLIDEIDSLAHELTARGFDFDGGLDGRPFESIIK
jgi:hypothetical protein